MANNISAKKRIKINRRNNIRNNSCKSKTKTYIKRYLILVEEYKIKGDKTNLDKISFLLRDTISEIDKAVKKNVYHKNSASRKKSKLQKLYNTL